MMLCHSNTLEGKQKQRMHSLVSSTIQHQLLKHINQAFAHVVSLIFRGENTIIFLFMLMLQQQLALEYGITSKTFVV